MSQDPGSSRRSSSRWPWPYRASPRPRRRRCAPPAPSPRSRIDSEPGDWVGGGQQLEYAPPAAIVHRSTTVRARIAVRAGVRSPEGGDFWNMSLRRARAGPLAVGTLRERAALRGCHPSGPRCRRAGPWLQHDDGSLRDHRDRARRRRRRHHASPCPSNSTARAETRPSLASCATRRAPATSS